MVGVGISLVGEVTSEGKEGNGFASAWFAENEESTVGGNKGIKEGIVIGSGGGYIGPWPFDGIGEWFVLNGEKAVFLAERIENALKPVGAYFLEEEELVAAVRGEGGGGEANLGGFSGGGGRG